MKKLFLTVCVAVFLSASALPMTARANDGDGHDAGYQCTTNASTPGCPPAGAQPNAATAGGSSSTATGLSYLAYVISLLPKN